MEIDARTIREVEFREKIRGYNPDDVDDFLEQVAVAFEVIEDRLRRAPAQPASVETSAVGQVETREMRGGASIVSSPLDRSKTAPTATSEFDADTIQRTLLLAQKTADATVKAAEEQAEISLGEAKAKADVLINQAMHRAREIVDDAVNQARDEVLDLAKSKDKLLSELNQLNSRLAGARDQMKRLLEGVMDQIEGSFTTAVRGMEPTSVQPVEPGPPDHAETTPQSSGQLLKESGHGNSSGVFDDELE